MLNDPDTDQRTPQLVIADDEAGFRQQAKRRLRYLSDEQRIFIEQIQPYHGNEMLGLLGKMAGAGKHRRLLAVRDCTGFHIYFGEMEQGGEYEGCFVYPVGQGCAVFARPRERPKVLLMDKYDAFELLMDMIEQVVEIVQVSFCVFEGRPLKLIIVP